MIYFYLNGGGRYFFTYEACEVVPIPDYMMFCSLE